MHLNANRKKKKKQFENYIQNLENTKSAHPISKTLISLIHWRLVHTNQTIFLHGICRCHCPESCISSLVPVSISPKTFTKILFCIAIEDVEWIFRSQRSIVLKATNENSESYITVSTTWHMVGALNWDHNCRGETGNQNIGKIENFIGYQIRKKSQTVFLFLFLFCFVFLLKTEKQMIKRGKTANGKKPRFVGAKTNTENRKYQRPLIQMKTSANMYRHLL